MAAPRSLSLERKLPLLISVFLAALAVGLTVAGYREVRQASEQRGTARLQSLAGQLAELSGGTTVQRVNALRRVSADARVQRYLASPDADSALERAATDALRGLVVTAADSVLVAEIRSVSETVRLATQAELPEEREPISDLVATMLSRGKSGMGELYLRRDSVFFWAGAPVVHDGRILGYVLQRRVIAGNPRVEQQIRDLAGNDQVSIYVVSDSGHTWSSVTGKPASPPVFVREKDTPPNVVYYDRAGVRYVAVLAAVANTPMSIVAETPYETLLERPTTYLRRSIAVASLLLLIGIASAWLLSRRITRPLRDLTVAADAISSGDYHHRATVGVRDETGRLAEAFNLMATQVQQSHADLERQIAESRLLAARLEEANRAKADFLATMSHELRTPLNAIAGYVELIELGVRGPVTAEQRRDLERVRYNQRQLLALIGNILDFTRLDAEKLPFDLTTVHVDHVVRNVLAGVEPLLDEKSLGSECVGCDADVVARADPARLEQILLNLLSNAIRFTPVGGGITVATAENAGQVEVAVSDTGIGIPREKLELIFEPFVQVENGLTRRVGGTGLGLTISRALARGMGGDLTADSDGATWATFKLTLPSASRQAAVRDDRERAQLARTAT
jgi:signal transduction histidine kinase